MLDGAEIIVSSLFGPDAVREVITGPGLIPAGGDVGGHHHRLPRRRPRLLRPRPGRRHAGPGAQVAELVTPWAAADPERLTPVDSAAKAASGKLLANLALAVSAQGLLEALYLGEAEGLDAPEILPMLDYTGLAFIKNMKAPFILGERETTPGDFTVDAIAKNAQLMIDTASAELGAARAALGSLQGEQDTGRGDHDFSSMIVHRR